MNKVVAMIGNGEHLSFIPFDGLETLSSDCLPQVVLLFV
ncbi:MAG: hypothetical protein ACJARG_001254 [Arcticibacterium sp.]|jgi:hypothetical protein